MRPAWIVARTLLVAVERSEAESWRTDMMTVMRAVSIDASNQAVAELWSRDLWP